MKLIELKTNLKSLKYGGDRPGGGSSNQPYIVTPIPNDLTSNSPDFLLRQGALQASLTDFERLTKFFTDNSSPRGILFTTKQIALERQNPAVPGGLIRAYLPTSTLSQTLVLPEGIHLNKQGVDPFELSYAQGGTGGYFNYTLNKDVNEEVSRLSLLFNSKISSQERLGLRTSQERKFHISRDPEYSLSYNGGPDSIGGIGRTRVRLAGNGSYAFRDRTNTYKINNLNTTDHNILYKSNHVYVYDSKLLTSQDGKNESEFEEKTKIISLPKNRSTSLNNIIDFRAVINKVNPDAKLPSTQYSTFNREESYGVSKTLYHVNRSDANTSISSDDINIKSPLFEENSDISNLKNKDLISFYFEILNPSIKESKSQTEYLFFRAYINDLGDNYKAEWSNYKYIGRAENFYKYNSFGRDISLGFTIYAHSRAEMKPLYEKLNRLVGTTAPTYSKEGFMMGNILKITVGNYFNNVPGILTSINLKPSFEAGWDINRNNKGGLFTDNDKELNVGQLPRMIDVTMNFNPIHTFTPQYKESFINSPLTSNFNTLTPVTPPPLQSNVIKPTPPITGNINLLPGAIEVS